MITIDELRILNGTPAQEGLGVIKFRFNEHQAYHFYSGEIHKVRNTGIHNHHHSFTSEVLKGELKNYIYRVDGTDPDSTYQIIRKKSKINAKYIIEQNNVNLIEACSFTTMAGQSYHIEYTTLHKIECKASKVITYLNFQSRPRQETINFARDTSLSIFSKPHPSKSESQCWEIIEDILND